MQVSNLNQTQQTIWKQQIGVKDVRGISQSIKHIVVWKDWEYLKTLRYKKVIKRSQRYLWNSLKGYRHQG
jgi:hypothetical protein